MKLLKLIGKIGILSYVGILIACNDILIDPFDPVAQQEEDIAIIEEYLADNGYTDYDTLESEIRVVILEEGTGDAIEYNDNIQYDYIGKFTDGTLFDTSIGDLALEQDQVNALDTTYVVDDDGNFELDDNGEKIIEEVTYVDDYSPIFSTTRSYQSFITTHTIEGWFLQSNSDFQRGASGFPLGVHHILENTKIGGRGLVLLPSFLGYGTLGTFGIDPNTVILFEILPVRKQ